MTVLRTLHVYEGREGLRVAAAVDGAEPRPRPGERHLREIRGVEITNDPQDALDQVWDALDLPTLPEGPDLAKAAAIYRLASEVLGTPEAGDDNRLVEEE